MSKPLLVLIFCCLVAPSLNAREIAEFSQRVLLPVHDTTKELGEVRVEIAGEVLMGVEKTSFLQALGPHLSQAVIAQIKLLPGLIPPSQLPMKLSYDPVELRLVMPLLVEQRNTDSLRVVEDYHKRYQGEALMPAPVSGAVNYRLEQSWASGPDAEDYFSGQFESFLNVGGFVFEGQTFYQSNTDPHWYRGDTRLVKDFQDQQVRVQLGDVYPLGFGFMLGRPLGGVSVGRNFGLNPYRLPYPSANQEFSLQSRSLVNYFVNGVLVKSEYLPAGNYTAKDIPLNNGLNTVVIEALDDLGQKKVFVFRAASSVNLLSKGESRYDLSHGVPFLDQNFKRTYLSEEDRVTSGFYQYGVNSQFSPGIYGQNQGDYNLLGAEAIFATVFGNFGVGEAYSFNSNVKGLAHALSYQHIGEGSRTYLSHTLTLRFEHRAPEFRSTRFDQATVVKNSLAANLTLPWADLFTVSVGSNYGEVRDNSLEDRFGFDATLNMRIFNRHNLSLFYGRSRDEFRAWNDVAYLFLTITFPENNNFVSAFYDQVQKTTKVNYLRDNQNRLYTPRAQALVEHSETASAGEVDLLFPTAVAEIGGRLSGQQLRGNQGSRLRSSLRLNSALVFAAKDGSIGWGLSRPVPGSFVLFKPQQSLSDQRVALKSTSPFVEAETGLLGELTYSNLIAYQYRELQLDPTYLDDGVSLTQEKFVVYPTYRSGHLIPLKDKGSIMLRGILVDSRGRPLPLLVGSVGGKTFFTNRDGEFFIDGIEPGSYEFAVAGKEKTSIAVKSGRGIINVGPIVLEDEP